jgi:hypothetical protein
MGGNDQICGRLSRCVALERFKAQHWSRIIRELMTPAMVLGESRFKHFTGAPRRTNRWMERIRSAVFSVRLR